jgi:hypothetical protein
MQVEPIGIVTIILGLIGLLAGQRFAVTVFFLSVLLGAAAAFILPSLGGANIQPSNLLLLFLTFTTISSRKSLHRAAGALVPPNPGFWLLLTAAYAMLSAMFLPRILAGTIDVFSITRPGVGQTITSPLAPNSGNVTQPVYFVGDMVCFLLFYDTASRPQGLKTVVNAAILATALNLCFVVIDLGTYWAGISDALAFIRNANYRMLDEAVVLGFKRIVGSFAEASTFAYYTSGLFAFCTVLALNGVRPRLTGTLGFLSLVTLIFATSSTGFAAAGGFLALLFFSCLVKVLSGRVRKTTAVVVTIFPVLVAAGLVALRLDQHLWSIISDVFDASLVDKMSSASGIERTSWTEQALVDFAATYGLGAGAGSVRASSFPVAALGNIGLFGTLTYGIFILQVFWGRRGRWQHPFPTACQSAARWACLAQLIGASVSGSFIDLGLEFFIFAGLACAGPEPVARRVVQTRASRRAAAAA